MSEPTTKAKRSRVPAFRVVHCAREDELRGVEVQRRLLIEAMGRRQSSWPAWMPLAVLLAACFAGLVLSSMIRGAL